MFKRLLMVAVVFAIFAMPVAAQDVAPMWHCDSVSVTQTGSTYRVVASGAGAYWRIKAVGGGTVAGPQQSPVFANVTLGEGQQYQVQAADSSTGPWSNNTACIFTVTPLAVVIDAFNVYCEQAGVRLEWSLSTELLSTRYLIAKDGDAFLDVPADCPGCTAPASYVRSVATATPNGVYSLLVYNGDGLVDLEETSLSECNVPTAVRVSSFTAKARKWWQIWP